MLALYQKVVFLLSEKKADAFWMVFKVVAENCFQICAFELLSEVIR